MDEQSGGTKKEEVIGEVVGESEVSNSKCRTLIGFWTEYVWYSHQI